MYRKIVRMSIDENMVRVYYIRSKKPTYLIVDVWNELYENGNRVGRYKIGRNLAFGRSFIHILSESLEEILNRKVFKKGDFVTARLRTSESSSLNNKLVKGVILDEKPKGFFVIKNENSQVIVNEGEVRSKSDDISKTIY